MKRPVFAIWQEVFWYNNNMNFLSDVPLLLRQKKFFARRIGEITFYWNCSLSRPEFLSSLLSSSLSATLCCVPTTKPESIPLARFPNRAGDREKRHSWEKEQTHIKVNTVPRNYIAKEKECYDVARGDFFYREVVVLFLFKICSSFIWNALVLSFTLFCHFETEFHFLPGLPPHFFFVPPTEPDFGARDDLWSSTCQICLQRKRERKRAAWRGRPRSHIQNEKINGKGLLFLFLFPGKTGCASMRSALPSQITNFTTSVGLNLKREKKQVLKVTKIARWKKGGEIR